MPLFLNGTSGAGASGTRITVPFAWCSWNGLYGGAALGMLIEEMERVSGQRVFSASAQFLRHLGKSGDEVALQAEVLTAGTAATQMRGVLRRGDKECMVVSASSGQLSAAASFGGVPPQVPSPDQCPPRGWLRPMPGSMQDTMDVRIAAKAPQHATLWARCPGAAGQPMSMAVLAPFSDHPPFGLSLLLGGQHYGITLEATLRCTAALDGLDAASWVLIDMMFDSMDREFAVATLRMWSETGMLLATAGQALRVRDGITSQAEK